MSDIHERPSLRPPMDAEDVRNAVDPMLVDYKPKPFFSLEEEHARFVSYDAEWRAMTDEQKRAVWRIAFQGYLESLTDAVGNRGVRRGWTLGDFERRRGFWDIIKTHGLAPDLARGAHRYGYEDAGPPDDSTAFIIVALGHRA